MKRNYFLLATVLTLGAVAGSIVFNPRLPAVVPVHWNIHGQVDRYGSKWEALLLIPVIMAGTVLLMGILPWLSPKTYEVNKRKLGYLQIMIVLLVFLAYIQLVLLSAAAGGHVDIGKAVMGGLSALFAALGPLLNRLPRNFYVGVRTPWTLANEHVWQSTHQFAAKSFTTAGLITLILTFVGITNWAGIVLLGTGAMAPVIYSLVLYKQLERRGGA
jgi:uncharacterized membrane protein